MGAVGRDAGQVSQPCSSEPVTGHVLSHASASGVPCPHWRPPHASVLGPCLCECLKATLNPVFMGLLSNMQSTDCLLAVSVWPFFSDQGS